MNRKHANFVVRCFFVGTVSGCAGGNVTTLLTNTAADLDAARFGDGPQSPCVEAYRAECFNEVSRTTSSGCMDTVRRKCEYEEQIAEEKRQRDGEALVRADEDRRQARCVEELRVLENVEARERASEERRRELASCPNASLPPGTYENNDGPTVHVAVTEGGCAAYNIFYKWVGEFYFSESQGEWFNVYRCELAGVLSADGSVNHSFIEGDCSTGKYDVTPEGTKIAVSKGGESLRMKVRPVDGGERTITMTKKSDHIELDNTGRPRIWTRAQRRSYMQDVAQVMDTRSTPGQLERTGQGGGIDALYRFDQEVPAQQSACKQLEAYRRTQEASGNE